jgi:hypothetical protein
MNRWEDPFFVPAKSQAYGLTPKPSVAAHTLK